VTRDEIFLRLQTILVESFELDEEEIRLEAHLIDDLDLDSIDAIDLAVGLEKELGLEVTEEELRGLQRIENIIELVSNRLSPP
jgi:acyl carrier protein